MELLSVDTVDEARCKLLELARPLFTQHETLATPQALGRVLAQDIQAQEDIPAFTRSTVDGYAVVASDTAGAGESIPSVLTMVGAVEMGADAASFAGLEHGIVSGECAYVPTGGMLPIGSDAMVMIEHTEGFGADRVGIYAPVASGANVVQRGDDIKHGALVCAAGTRVGVAEVGVAAALGLTELAVYRQPRMIILSTGDEIVAPETTPLSGQIRDINSWALSAQAEQAGFEVVDSQVVADVEEALRASVAKACEQADIVVISGGSSQGEKDATAKIINTLASSGVLTHGLALKPGKPTITGFDEPSSTLLIGLPGHPLSAMMVFEISLAWLLREVQGTPQPTPLQAQLTHNVAGAAGKETLQLVKLAWSHDVLTAVPVYTKSGLISKLSEADGFLWIDRNTEGLVAGSSVAVHPFCGA